MEWLTLLIPFICIGLTYIFFSKHIVWYELFLPLIVPIIFIPSCETINYYSVTTDVEVWGGYVVTANHFEDWNERVSCRHPKYRTIRGADGKTTTVFDGYQHLYDVDYHPEYFETTDNNNIRHIVPEGRYNDIVKFFGNKSFVELNRSYHTNDGDMYTSNYAGKTYPFFSQHTYTNKVQNSKSVLLQTAKNNFVYEYPKFDYFNSPAVLGWAYGDKLAQEKNAILGKIHQVKMYFLIYKDRPLQASYAQESHWKGGNQNEFVCCIGLRGNEVSWCRCFCWSPDGYSGNETIKINVRDYVTSNKFDMDSIVEYTSEQIKLLWKKKDFSEFDYIHVNMTSGNLIALVILTILASVGVCSWCVLNEVDNEGEKGLPRLSEIKWVQNLKMRLRL